MLINNLILTKLDFCNSVLAACPQNDLYHLQRVLNDSVRFIFNIRKRDHITAHLKKLHFLPVRYRILFKLSILAHRIVYCTAPLYLLELFDCYQPMSIMNLRPRSNISLNPMLKYINDNELPYKCVYTRLINCWNELPLSLRLCECFTDFKRRLKTHYFSQAFEC